MADEAEKLINLSLCKMAESRTVRRGGASLHKHLLISTVLTKARSAYFETWYMGEGESTIMDGGGNGRPINLNASYQEVDFPLDDDEDDEELLEDPLGDLSSPNNNSSSAAQSHEEGHDDSLTNQTNNNNNMIDPRFFVEVESEIELPSDILSCVEKLGDISEHMSFSVDESASPTSLENVGNRTSDEMILSDSGIERTPAGKQTRNYENVSRDTQLTYLDLDSKSTQELSITTESNNNNNNENSNNNNSDDDDDTPVFGSPLRASTPNASKRRRGWSLEEDDEDEGHGTLGSSDSIVTSNPRFSDEFNEKLKRNGLSIINVAKRLRFSPECEEEEEPLGMQMQQQSGEPSSYNNEILVKSAKPLPVITDSKFRVKKPHFEEDDPEDSDDDPFLGDSLGQGSPLDSDNDQIQILSRRNDQRVPSASSSGSSSDEDCEAENSMEVDQIHQLTNFMQFISFNNKQHQSQSPTPTSCSSGGSTMSTTSAGLVRSMSTPDLCGLAAASSSRVSNSANNAKDLFSYNNNNSHISHRILTLTV